ncbi:hypothetical protein XCR1_1210011 [Xenorhabdus cabanillasii JM26]|uniref:Uncharacterized protein n=1 Tax=Xenorhabdus cabanillasii JM26 TaxID=1427517 RepID=W1IPE4_9GAMM|nr:hypothetical protein XCR1_1210011 [Xenorhabdus cabanillasii JM26]
MIRMKLSFLPIYLMDAEFEGYKQLDLEIITYFDQYQSVKGKRDPSQH